MEKVLGRRIFVKIIGTDVPHVHVHLIPQDETYVEGETLSLGAEEMERIASELRLD